MPSVFIETGRIGSAVLTVPLMRMVAKYGPMYLAAPSHVIDLLGEQPWIAGTVRILPNMQTESTQVSFSQAFSVFAYHPTIKKIAGALGVVGKVNGFRMGKEVQIGERIRQATGDVPRIDVLPEMRARARSLIPLPNSVGIQICAGATGFGFPVGDRSKKNLPQSLAMILANEMIEQGKNVVFFGSASERETIAKITDINKAFDNIAGRISLRDLPGALSLLDYFISCDTGPAHVAAAVGCPLRIFYRNSDPMIWMPATTSSITCT